MEEALNSIARAILELQSNPIKDYIFPAVSALFTAALGAWAALYAVSTQEHNRIQIQNADAANTTLLNASEALNNLTTIKSNYFQELTSHPIQRILDIPPFPSNSNPISFHAASLVFLAPTEECKNPPKWQHITYIESLFRNYNYLLNIWKKRNDLMEPLMFEFAKFHGKKKSIEEFEKIIGHGQSALLSDLTEQAVMMTDELIIGFKDFLLNFPAVSNNAIPKKIKKKYRKILSMKCPDNNEYKKLLSPTPELDFKSASQIHHVSEEDLQKRYRKIYSETIN